MLDPFSQRFSGIARLLGSEALDRLRAAHVCVIGGGGVGSWTIEALARSGIGALTLIDADDVCITNTNRQLPALDGDYGRPKVQLMAERIARINPECRVVPIAEFFTPSNAEALLAQKFDFVVDAVDRMSSKARLIHLCRERSLPVLVCGAAGGRRDPALVRVTDLGFAGQDELLRQVRRNLRTDYGWARGLDTRSTPMGVRCVFSPEKPVYPRADGTCAPAPEPGDSLRMDCATGVGAAVFVTGTFGFLAAHEVVTRISR